MATNPPDRQVSNPEKSVTDWLLDSDSSMRWQVMRDLTGSPAEEVAAERARVATEGAGARLLALQGRMGSGAARRGTVVGTPRCTSSCCCGTWVSIPRATRHVARWGSSVTASPGRAAARRSVSARRKIFVEGPETTKVRC